MCGTIRCCTPVGEDHLDDQKRYFCKLAECEAKLDEYLETLRKENGLNGEWTEEKKRTEETDGASPRPSGTPTASRMRDIGEGECAQEDCDVTNLNAEDQCSQCQVLVCEKCAFFADGAILCSRECYQQAVTNGQGVLGDNRYSAERATTNTA